MPANKAPKRIINRKGRREPKLKAAGASYYVRTSESLDVGTDNVLVRLVTSFSTVDEDIDRFVDLCKKS